MTTTLPNPPSRFPTDRGKSALALVQSGALEHPVYLDDARTRRLVPSCSGNGSFYVTSEHECSCNDRTYRNVICKHMLACKVDAVLKSAADQNTVAA